MKKEFLVIFVLVFLSLIAIVTASTFIDNQESDFNEGTYNWTFYNSSVFVQLNESRLNGTFTSQIFDATTNSTWNNISWFIEIPYNQELPDNQVIETGDFLRGANMTGNVLLMHLNNDSAYGENDSYVYDFSGNGNNGTLINGDGDEVTSSGKLNGAFKFTGADDDYIQISDSDLLSIDPGTNSVTMSAWIKPHLIDTSWDRVLIKGLSDSTGYQLVLYNGEIQASVCNSSDYNDAVDKVTSGAGLQVNNWYHVAVVYNGTYSLNGFKIYIDGIEVSGGDGSDLGYGSGSDLLIGRRSDGHGTNSTIDEVAIWNRSLSATEVLDIYKRGALRLNLSVQSCNDASCDGESWTNLGSNLTSPQNLSVSNNQYFQYKFEFDTDNSSYSPELYNVSLDYDALASPVVNISLIFPTTNISVYKNKFFNFTVNVSCSGANCGEINVSLDPVSCSADGGTITTDGDYCVHTFTSNGTFNWTGSASNIEVLVVAGGGGGGAAYGGGGGGGGLIYNSSFPVTAQKYNITIGGGGAGSPAISAQNIADNGGNSTFSTLIAVGGGGGAGYLPQNGPGANGGSGGGGTYGGLGGDGISEQGFSGGKAFSSAQYGGGGGGGAGEIGYNGTTSAGGAGGNGLNYTINGSNIYYAGGGGGSTWVSGTGGAGGAGGGGAGGDYNEIGLNGSVNSGSGGGGGGFSGSTLAGGKGGSGIVIIKYLLSSGKGGLINTTAGATPFYTNASSNPLNISLNNGESQLVTFWVNSTGEYDASYDFFAYANVTSNLSIGAITETLNITIISNPIELSNSVQSPESPTNYVGQYQFNITVYDYDGDYHTVYFSWNNGANQTITTYENVSGGREYYHSQETAITGNNLPFSWFANDTQGNTNTSSGTYIISALQTSASLALDKIISLQELNSTDITYNITLRTTNKGGSDSTSVILTDSDSSVSPYNLGTIGEGEINSTSYLKTYSRNSTTYNSTLAIATVNGTDSYQSNETSANSTEIILIIPSSTANTTLTILKNAEYLSENLTDINYNLTVTVVNSGGTDLTSIAVQDSDINLDTSINLNRTQTYSISGTKSISKTSLNVEHTFEKANATYNAITYDSNELKVLIPGYGSSGNLFLVKSASLLETTSTNVTYNISLSLTNNGGRNLTSVEINDSDSSSSPYNIGTLTSGQEVLRSYTKTYNRTTYASNQTLVSASANGTDTISGLVETTSGEILIVIPGTQTSASFVLDKIATIQNMTNTTINYNITLRVVNKGGSDTTSTTLTDSDSTSSPYDLTTVSANSTVVRSYIKSYTRNSTTYNSTLVQARVNGTDSYSGNEIEANSSSIVLVIPATTASEQLTLIKNAYYNSENSTAVNYTVSLEVVNSGGVDLSSITVIDTDLDLSTSVNLNRTQNYTNSGVVLVDKAASNTNKLFVKASATVNAVVYQSNQINVRIPGYGGPADAIVYAPASVQTSTSFDTTITVENQNPDIGQDFTIEYWITNVAEDTNYTSGEQTIYVAASGSSDLTATLTSPSSAGSYRYRAVVTWAGGTATAYDSFEVTAPASDDSGDSGSSGGGGSITGKTVEEVVCNPPYIRYGKECCLDTNNNSMCDKDEILESPEENETGTGEIGQEETPTKTQTFLSNVLDKISNFFKPAFAYMKQNNLYFIIGFGSLIFVLLLIIIIVKMSRKRKKSKQISGLETKLKHLKELKHKKKISEKSYHTEKEELLQKINKVLKNKHFLLIIGAFGLLALFSIFLKPTSITGGVIGVDSVGKINWWIIFAILVILLLIGIFGTLLYIFKEIKRIKVKLDKNDRLNENSVEKPSEDDKDKDSNKELIRKEKYKTKNISEIINKKVYTSSGYYLGKIKEIILGKNRIDSLKIKLDKKQKFRVKGIIIKYNNVKSVGHIIIADSNILNKLDSLED